MNATAAVGFDLDGTLCVSAQSDREIHHTAFRRAGVEPPLDPGDLRATPTDAIEPAESRAAFYAYLYVAAAERLDVDLSTDLATTVGRHAVEIAEPTAVEFRDGAKRALEQITTSRPIGLITNGPPETQAAKLDRLGIRETFDAVVYCAPATGIAGKPDTEPFAVLDDRLPDGVEMKLFVGNDHLTDVVGAHRAGIDSVWVPRTDAHHTAPDDPEPAPTRRVDDLRRLPTLV